MMAIRKQGDGVEKAIMRDIVLLPGFMLNRHLWDDMQPGLSHLGTIHHGDITHDDTIAAMAARVLESAPATFILCGFSMGGFVAQEIVLRAPERVEALILLNTSSRAQTTTELAAIQAQLSMMEKMPFRGLTSRALASAVHSDRVDDVVLRNKLQSMAIDNGKEVFIRQLSTLREGSLSSLHAIRCPVLIVGSDGDRLRVAEESEEMARRIPQSRLEIMTHCGHMTPLEKPAELLAVMTQWIHSLP